MAPQLTNRSTGQHYWPPQGNTQTAEESAAMHVDAKRVVECCLLMDPKVSYIRARQLLKQRFGDNFRVSNAWVSKVTGGPPVKGSNALQELADELSCCKET